MLTEFASYRAKKQRKINAKMANMRKAKECKKLASPAPEYPVEITENWVSVEVKRCINGRVQTERFFGDGIDANSYVAWRPETKECLGAMSLRRILLEAAKKFVRVQGL